MSARGYRASLLWFPDPAQPVVRWEEDGLLVLAPDAQGRQVVQAIGDWRTLSALNCRLPVEHLPGLNHGHEPTCGRQEGGAVTLLRAQRRVHFNHPRPPRGQHRDRRCIAAGHHPARPALASAPAPGPVPPSRRRPAGPAA